MTKEDGIETPAPAKGIDFFGEAADGVHFIEGGLTRVRGISASGVHAGFKKDPDLPDLALVFAPCGANAAGVFTQNRFCAAPVRLSRERLAGGKAKAIILNSGNANAATGAIGFENAEREADLVGEALGCGSGEVLVASTGVIGVQLDMDLFEPGIMAARDALGASNGEDAGSGLDAARAIMTTDTVPKQAAVEFALAKRDGTSATCRVGGMSKGSGMIEPNMATMLAVVATDACVSPSALQAALKESADVSFNRITVDSDTSTNDSLFMLATGTACDEEVDAGHPSFGAFVDALKTVCVSLARQMAADGEGATKLVTVKVSGAKDDEEALIAAKSVANSPLVKTAIAGHDANWGRLAAALGKSGAAFDQENVSISFMGIEVCRDGLALDFDEDEALRRFEADEIAIEADLGAGDGYCRVWTCDLTHDYISINADYRT